MKNHEASEWIDRAALQAPLARLMSTDHVTIGEWSCQQAQGGAGNQLGIWRLTGTLNHGGTTQPWSMFLKAWAPANDESSPSAWNWPHREAAAYRSGVLASLPGRITAPRLLGETARPDGSHWLWLEDAGSDHGAAWPLTRYADAARLLGTWNGAYLTGHPLPADGWLSRNWLLHWVEAGALAMEMLARADEYPAIQRAFSPKAIAGFSQLWQDRHNRLAEMDTLPRTFCHLDAFRRNLFFRHIGGGMEEAVAIDWGFCGIGTVGEEIAPLVVASVAFHDVPGDDIRSLEHVVLDGYIRGLRDAGWTGSAELVWTGYANAAVLRYGIGSQRVLLPWLMDEGNYPRLEETMRRPIDDIIGQFRRLNDWLAELSVQARHGI